VSFAIAQLLSMWTGEMICLCRGSPWPYIHDQRVISLSTSFISFFVAACNPAYSGLDHFLARVIAECLAAQMLTTTPP
jgi:hypothetical protein